MTAKSKLRKIKNLMLCTTLLFLCSSISGRQKTHYVKANATGNDASWTDASGDLQAMINQSAAGDQIWVAQGTYYPAHKAGNGATDRDKAFVLKAGVKTYGGFAGSENSVAASDTSAEVSSFAANASDASAGVT